MKALILVSLILFQSCGAEKAAWSALSEAEQANLRARALELCRSESANSMATFKSRSASFFSNSPYDVGAQFNWTYKKDTLNVKSASIFVWHRTLNTDVYLYVTDDSEKDYSYFIKILASVNDTMITDLVEDYCGKIYDNGSISTSGMLITNIYDHPNGNERRNFTDNFSPEFDKLAFFAKYTIDKTAVTFDVNGQESARASYTSDFSYVGKVTLPADNTTPATDRYCVPATTSGRYRLRSENSFDTRLGIPLTCVAVKPGDWVI